jgi:hypothetical protein
MLLNKMIGIQNRNGMIVSPSAMSLSFARSTTGCDAMFRAQTSSTLPEVGNKVLADAMQGERLQCLRELVRAGTIAREFHASVTFPGYGKRSSARISMRESDPAQSSSGTNDFCEGPQQASVSQGLGKRCAQCGRPFGLVRRRRAGKQFCSARCVDDHATAVRKAVEAWANWLDFLQQRR